MLDEGIRRCVQRYMRVVDVVAIYSGVSNVIEWNASTALRIHTSEGMLLELLSKICLLIDWRVKLTSYNMTSTFSIWLLYFRLNLDIYWTAIISGYCIFLKRSLLEISIISLRVNWPTPRSFNITPFLITWVSPSPTSLDSKVRSVSTGRRSAPLSHEHGSNLTGFVGHHLLKIIFLFDLLLGFRGVDRASHMFIF